MAAELTRLTHKIVTQLHLVAESCTICISHSRWLVQKLLDTPSYVCLLKHFDGIQYCHFLIKSGLKIKLHKSYSDNY